MIDIVILTMSRCLKKCVCVFAGKRERVWKYMECDGCANDDLIKSQNHKNLLNGVSYMYLKHCLYIYMLIDFICMLSVYYYY